MECVVIAKCQQCMLERLGPRTGHSHTEDLHGLVGRPRAGRWIAHGIDIVLKEPPEPIVHCWHVRSLETQGERREVKDDERRVKTLLLSGQAPRFLRAVGMCSACISFETAGGTGRLEVSSPKNPTPHAVAAWTCPHPIAARADVTVKAYCSHRPGGSTELPGLRNDQSTNWELISAHPPFYISLPIYFYPPTYLIFFLFIIIILNT